MNGWMLQKKLQHCRTPINGFHFQKTFQDSSHVMLPIQAPSNPKNDYLKTFQEFWWRLRYLLMNKSQPLHLLPRDFQVPLEAVFCFVEGFLKGCYAALLRIFDEIALRNPNYHPMRMLDFGSGLGSSIWAAHEVKTSRQVFKEGRLRLGKVRLATFWLLNLLGP